MKPILLLHGALGSAAQLEPLQQHLSKEFTVHTLNFSGHGGNPLADDFSIRQFAREVLQYLQEQNLTQVAIFGYSMGGYVALQLAKMHPERVGKIFTLGTKFDWTPESAAREVKMLDPAKIKEKVPAFAETLQQRHAPNDWEVLLRKTADLMLALGNGAALSSDDLRSVQHAVRIGVGSQDHMVTMEESQQAARTLPKGEFLLLANTPHPIEKVNAQMLADAIAIFLQAN